jgi:Rrf2 family protein
MQISTKGRYALRLMLDLAVHNTGELVKIKDISARENISEKYLEQIISSLKKAGYVKSLRGAQGGYMLAREPETYTVGTILRLTEGSMKPVWRTNRISAAEPGNASHSVSGRCLIKLLREYWIRLHCRILKTGMKRWEMIM